MTFYPKVLVTRRKFHDSLTTDPQRAHEMLAMIGKLYAVERQAKVDGLDAIALRRLRQQHSTPNLDEIQCRLEDWSIEVLPKSPISAMCLTVSAPIRGQPSCRINAVRLAVVML